VSGPKRIARRRRRNVSSRGKCALHQPKLNGSFGGTCAIDFRCTALIIRRQVQIGRYIADFVCHAGRIVVEVDGSQHGPRSAADEERTKAIEANGYKVLRYWNSDVLTNIDGVLEDILSKINNDPHP
jgi:very-short-patch-repair endonuclease